MPSAPLPPLYFLPRRRAPVDFTCSDAVLSAGFEWARTTALGYVQTGKDPKFMECYWAGYPTREAFYLRDFAHQTAGAHLLGLDEENFAMASLMAKSATAERGYYPVWSYNFDGSIFAMDYHSATDFVRELPEPFDLIHRIGGMLRWSGEARLYADGALVSFYEATLDDFLPLHDPNKTGIASEFGGDGHNIFGGVATYNEQSGAPLGYSADAFASQYGAALALGVIFEARGDETRAAAARASARGLRTTFNTQWALAPNATRPLPRAGGAAGAAAGAALTGAAGAARADEAREKSTHPGGFLRGVLRNGSTLSGWGKTETMFPLIAGLAAGGSEQTDAAFALLEEYANSHTITECRCQMPEALFRYGRPDAAVQLLKGLLLDARRTYPEVSFAYVDVMVSGILGVAPDALGYAVTTTHRLPSSVTWANATQIAVGPHTIAVAHAAGQSAPGVTIPSLATTFASDAQGATSLQDLRWTARFAVGDVAPAKPTLWVDGTPTPAVVEHQAGDARLVLLAVNVTVPVGARIVVSTASA